MILLLIMKQYYKIKWSMMTWLFNYSHRTVIIHVVILLLKTIAYSETIFFKLSLLLNKKYIICNNGNKLKQTKWDSNDFYSVISANARYRN